MEIKPLDLTGVFGSLLGGLGQAAGGGPSSAFQDVQQNPWVGGDFLTNFGSGTLNGGNRDNGGKGGAVFPGGQGGGGGSSGTGGGGGFTAPGISQQTVLIAAAALILVVVIKKWKR
ncbi:hypothetical protein [Chitinilyticum aquatile]|uniref:hypothetical protein n=1 Tax=Chitinilyticum aquatile TaxID=362520 RepID=UPI000404FA04|nr:hypothetical protein [Chitinilyticum aquatile]